MLYVESLYSRNNILLFLSLWRSLIERKSYFATIIFDAVFNGLKSTNIRECVRIARLTHGNSDLPKLIIETLC